MAIETKYKTTEIFLASFLLAIGLNDYSLERRGKQVTFVFAHNPNVGDTEALVDSYFKNTIEVKPKLLFNAYRELKARIFDGI